MKLLKRKNKLQKFYYKNKEFIEYSMVSTVCTIILYVLYFSITYFTENYIFANFVAYVVSFGVLFIWDQKIFRSKPLRKKHRLHQLIIFIFFRVIGFIIDSSILVMLIEKFDLPNAVSKVMSSLITFMFNYITNKMFVFKKGKLL